MCSFFLAIVLANLVGCGGDKQASSTTSAPAKAVTVQEETIQAIFAKAKHAPGITYESITTMKGMAFTSRIWAEHDKVKLEQDVQGKKMILFFDGDNIYQYDPSSNSAVKFSTKGMEDEGMKKPDMTDYAEHMVPESLKVIETVTYEGVKCRVITCTMKNGDGTATMWVREDYGLPMKTELTTKTGEKIISENRNMKIGALPTSAFTLPEGVKIQDMGEMMKQMHQKK
jgi:outer membrane lipoprotein-sorting protein